MRFVVILFISFFGWLFNEKSEDVVLVPEICNNGIDDDMDGLIDLNDVEDCLCNGITNVIFSPSSLIPNPSFEDTLCCPKNVAQLSCAADWIQASSATSDFFHTCGYAFSPDRGRPPSPLPAGDGYVGVLDIRGVPRPTGGNIPYKEYIGACLNNTMMAGVDYTLQFYLGFGRAGTFYSAKSPMNIVLYGTEDCSNLPFGGRNYQDCPSKLPGWFEIASVVVRGSNEWKLATMKFKTTKNIEAVAMGPSCAPSIGGHYYFIDDLILNESRAFENIPLSIEGEKCEPFITLKGMEASSINYQWYRNGIALVGAISSDLIVAKKDTGNYRLRVDDGVDCQLSEGYPHYPLDFLHVVDTFLCQGQTLSLEGKNISSSFLDTFHYPGVEYCDSIIVVRVEQRDTTTALIDTSICKNSELKVGGESFTQGGKHKVVIPNHRGCDSIITIELSIKDTIFQTIDTAMCIGQSIDIKNKTYDKAGQFYQDFSDSRGCDIRLMINIEQPDTFLIVKDTTVCKGQPLRSGGPGVEVSSDIKLNLISNHGCDSTVLYKTKIFPTYEMVFDTFFCSGGMVILNGKMIDKAGSYDFPMISSENCDSLVTYMVFERTVSVTYMDTAICYGEEIIVFGDTLRQKGQYSITLQNRGCDSTAEVNLTILDSFMTIIDTSICLGEVLNWNGNILNSSGTYGANLMAQNGCDSTVQMALRIVDEPDYTMIVESEIDCYGDSTGVIVVSVDNPTAIILWSDGAVGERREFLSEGIYPFTIQYEVECQIFDSIRLDQPAELFLEVSSVNIPCMGDDDGKIIVDSMAGGTGELSILVDGEKMTIIDGVIDGISAGIKRVTLMDENGCTITKEVNITQQARGELQVDVSATEIVVGDSVVFTISTFGIDSLKILGWEGPEGMCLNDCKRWVVTPREGSSEYFLYAEDSYGCIYEYSIVIIAKKQFFIPNIFSPNGDHINDVFTVFDNGSLEIITSFEIFDRWGELIYYGQNLDPSNSQSGWDGRFNGSTLTPGVFIYRIQVMDKAGKVDVVTGDVTLML